MVTENRILLPKGIKPTHYALSLFPNMNDFTYTASVKIDLKITPSHSPDKIKLHSTNLIFNKIRMFQGEKNVQYIDTKSVTYNKEDETAEFPVSKLNAEEKTRLEIEYSGTINDQMRGFYRSNYKDSAGTTHIVGVTQFEPTDARWALPCWDEPAFKASFAVDLTVEKKFIALSNMDVKSKEEIKANTRYVFNTTPVMSTYLLAWFIGEYKGMTVKTANNVAVSIYAPPEELKKGEWALDVAKKTLTFFDDYFGKPYPLPKLDMLAINDFVNGAMENWGLVTYRDSAIYWDERSGVRAKEWVTSVVAHELAHQWFGNLVTMEWWSQLWLNEGFATFMQALANDKIYPEFNIWAAFVGEKLESALHLDSLESSHPIEVDIAHPKMINEVFDVISYKKGASVLRMLYEYIGDESFRKGVSSYLSDHEYGNVDSDALWTALSKSSGKNVEEFMHPLTRKQGYPLIEIEELEKTAAGRRFVLRQARFLLNENAEDKEGTLWRVPIKVEVGGEFCRWVYLDRAEMEIDVEGSGFVLFNAGATGFFRTLHKGALMADLCAAVESKKVSESDRFKIVCDLKALFCAGKVSACELLDFAKSFSTETCETVWSAVLGALEKVRGIVKRTDAEKRLNKFVIALTNPISSALGLSPKGPNEPASFAKLRAGLLAARARCEDETTVGHLTQLFAGDPAAIAPDVFRAAAVAAVEHGGAAEVAKAKTLAETLQSPALKNAALFAAGCSRQKGLAAGALEYALSASVRPQDSFFVFEAVAAGRCGSGVAWEFFKQKYDYLRETFTHDSMFQHFVSVVKYLETDELIADAEAFFAERDTKGYDKSLSQCLESAKMAQMLKKRELGNVQKWLESH